MTALCVTPVNMGKICCLPITHSILVCNMIAFSLILRLERTCIAPLGVDVRFGFDL